MDILVVGGGPGGLTAAISAIGKQGEKEGQTPSVMVVDRKEEIGVPVRCGEGTFVRILRMLSACGVDFSTIEEEGVISNHVEKAEIVLVKKDQRKGGALETKRVVARGKKLGAVILNRDRLEKLLAKVASERGAEIVTGKTVVGVEKEKKAGKGEAEKRAAGGSSRSSGRIVAALDDGEEITATVLIGADGVESRIGTSMGILKPLRPHDISVAVQHRIKGGPWEDRKDTATIYVGAGIAPWGYIWVFPKKEGVPSGTANVGIIVSGEHSRKAHNLLESFIERFWEGTVGERTETITGAAPTTTPISVPAHGNIALVGDAARATSALGAGGIHNAIFTGIIAGKAAGETVSVGKNRMAIYNEAWKKTIYKNLMRSHRLRERIYVSDARIWRFSKALAVASRVGGVLPVDLLSRWWGKYEKHL